MSLLLPWEVIERIVEHASNDLQLLCSFSLTCRQLYHCSFSLIIAQHVFLCSKERMSCFRNLLSTNTRLQPLVHSIAISPADVPPLPLVKMLPRLSTLVLVSHGYQMYDNRWERPAVVLHSMILSWYRSFGTHIRTLSLDHLSFPTSREFLRLLLAFPNINKLVCSDIYIISPTRDVPATRMVQVKLSNQVRLEMLEVRFCASWII